MGATVIKTNESEYQLVTDGNQIIVEISKGLIKTDNTTLLEATLKEHPRLLNGTLEQQADSVKWQYTVPVTSMATIELQKHRTRVDRIRAAGNIGLLKNLLGTRIVPLIHPDNLVWDENLTPQVIHRGLQGLVPPTSLSETAFIQSYKSLALSIIDPGLNFADLNDGNLNRVKQTPFNKSLLAAQTVDELTQLLQNAYETEFDRFTATTATVSRSKHKVYQTGFYLMTVIALALAAGLAYFALVKVPFDNKMASGQTSFLSDNYDQTISTWENVNPKKLSKTNQYILATSYVNVEKLSTTQKKNVLKNVTLSSDSNYLLFWIYDGRGDFKAALNLAKYVNDDQLILYTYTKLYDQANTNTSLSGSKKQSLLKGYQKQITKYSKKVGGAKNAVAN